MDATTAVRVRGLIKRYGQRTVVDRLDLDVQHGECVAILGPNGAGKTTTVEILEGFRRRDGGEVAVLGHDPARADRSWRGRIGVVAQAVGAEMELTVAETVRHFAVYHARPREHDEVIAAVGLQDSANVRIANLSGGQRRRLDVALGLQGRPDLIFLDEPTTGMDPTARRQFWSLIRSVGAEGATILLTTHYLDEAANLAHRVAVIAGGRLVETAAPDRLGASLGLGTKVRWSESGHPREVTTDQPTAVLRDLLARNPSGEIADLQVQRPTLEDVYLELVGDQPTEQGVS